jgi:tripartite-type tricarboxylate transporter receptor subunit TctC
VLALIETFRKPAWQIGKLHEVVKKILLLLLLSPTLPAFGQEYPSRPITLVVPFSAGGPGDVIARLLGNLMSATLKQPVVIENVVGAIGTNRVAKAAPDGHTLLLMHVGQATAPALYAKLPFDPIGDFAPIGLVTDVPMILVARPNFPAKDLKELVAMCAPKGTGSPMATWAWAPLHIFAG